MKPYILSALMVCLFGIGFAGQAQTSKIAIYDGPPVIQKIKGRAVPVTLADGFRAFSDKSKVHGFFGAFAVADDAGWGYVTGYHGLNAAQKSAISICRANSDFKRTCKIYAIMVPKGYDPKDRRPTVNMALAKDLKTEVPKHLKNFPYVSVYIDQRVDYAWQMEAISHRVAKSKAIAACKKYSADSQENFYSDNTALARKIYAGARCKEILVLKP